MFRKGHILEKRGQRRLNWLLEGLAAWNIFHAMGKKKTTQQLQKEKKKKTRMSIRHFGRLWHHNFYKKKGKYMNPIHFIIGLFPGKQNFWIFYLIKIAAVRIPYPHMNSNNLTLVLSSISNTRSCMGILKLCRMLPPNTKESAGVYTAWIHPEIRK